MVSVDDSLRTFVDWLDRHRLSSLGDLRVETAVLYLLFRQLLVLLGFQALKLLAL